MLDRARGDAMSERADETKPGPAEPTARALNVARVILFPFRGLASEEMIRDAALVIDEAFE